MAFLLVEYQFEFVGLFAGTKLRLDFVARMASSHDATSRIVCADLYYSTSRKSTEMRGSCDKEKP